MTPAAAPHLPSVDGDRHAPPLPLVGGEGGDAGRTAPRLSLAMGDAGGPGRIGDGGDAGAPDLSMGSGDAGGGVLGAAHAAFRRGARTFHLAAALLPREVRDDAAVVYAFCRLVDDVADEGDDPAAADAALARLAAEVRGEAPARPLVAAFRETADRLGMGRESALELLAGVRGDLRAVRIRDDAELIRYCYRVASTVGLMMCGVLRVSAREALPHAVDLGIAMQLTNVARDVAEDARRGRVYLPADRLRAAGGCPEALVRGECPRDAAAAVVRWALDEAERYYASADGGMRDIPARFRPAILAASRMYRAIGLRLRARGCDALAGRTVVPLPLKLCWTARALAASLRPEIRGASPRGAHDRALHRALRGLPGAHA
jgi:phytoene synthase